MLPLRVGRSVAERGISRGGYYGMYALRAEYHRVSVDGWGGLQNGSEIRAAFSYIVSCNHSRLDVAYYDLKKRNQQRAKNVLKYGGIRCI